MSTFTCHMHGSHAQLAGIYSQLTIPYHLIFSLRFSFVRADLKILIMMRCPWFNGRADGRADVLILLLFSLLSLSSFGQCNVITVTNGYSLQQYLLGTNVQQVHDDTILELVSPTYFLILLNCT